MQKSRTEPEIRTGISRKTTGMWFPENLRYQQPLKNGCHVMECGVVIIYYHAYEIRAGVHETRIWCMHFTSFVHASYMFHA